MLFAVNKPTGWTIDSITYVSPEYGTGYFTYLGNEADEAEEGGIEIGWEDSVEAFQPSADGMHWQMYVSDQDTTSSSTEADPDSFNVVVNYTVDNTAGSYLLKYYTTHTNNLDEDSLDNIAMDSANIVAYDPATSNFVTFTVVDNSWSNTNVMYKGTATDWGVVQMYDDGTNGDATADDHIWTVSIANITEGDHQWGAVENDGSTYGVWLIQGDNPSFNLEADLVTYHGHTSYVIPAPSGEELVTFTLNDNSWLIEDVMFKGTMSGWAVFQGYDDGTNGDVTADDHIWTAQYVTANGDHAWGAIDTDNGDGTVCVACDGSDGYGTWLIEGDNPAFSLLDGDVTEDCLSDFVFSGIGGSTLTSEFGSSGGDDGSCDDVDEDGICDDVDDCVGAYDECGICNGDGIADGACDCDGNVDDECGECGGDGVDADDDGICDDVDDCVGEYDECGVCNGDGIADGACDCDGNVEDCAGVCGGDAVVDECGVCNGDGIADGACDCDGNVTDCAGECGGSAEEDCAGDCAGSAELDACGVCEGDETGPENCLQYFTDLPNGTGLSSLVIIQNALDLDVGDEIGLFDNNAILNSGDCSSETGELLVAAGVWTGEQLDLVGVGSIDNCAFGGFQLPGYQDGNSIVYKVWKAEEDRVYDAEVNDYSAGTGTWGDILTAVALPEDYLDQ